MKKYIAKYKGLPHEMIYICLAQVINRFGDFVVPFLTLFLTIKMGISASAAASIVMLASVIGIPAALLGGKVADIIGRKTVYMISQSATALFLIPCAFIPHSGLTVVLLLVSSFFASAVNPAFVAMITDILPTNKRQQCFSLSYLSINIGVALGPLVAGILFNNRLTVFFLGDAATSFIAVLLIALHIPASSFGKKAVVSAQSEKAASGNLFKMLLGRPQFLISFILKLIYDFVYSQHSFTIPLVLTQTFAENGSEYYGYMMSINAITVLVFTLFLSSLTSKLHQLTNLSIVGVLYAIGFGGVCVINNFSGLLVSTMLWTSGEILCSVSSGVYIAANSPVNFRARIQSLNSCISLGGSSLGILVCGIFTDVFGLSRIGVLLFAVAIIGAALMYALKIYACRSVLTGENVVS